MHIVTPIPSFSMVQIYEGEVEAWLMSDYCTDTVPVLLRRSTFCRAFAADAKDFRAYNSWVRSSLGVDGFGAFKVDGRVFAIASSLGKVGFRVNNLGFMLYFVR